MKGRRLTRPILAAATTAALLIAGCGDDNEQIRQAPPRDATERR